MRLLNSKAGSTRKNKAEREERDCWRDGKYLGREDLGIEEPNKGLSKPMRVNHAWSRRGSIRQIEQWQRASL